MNKNYFIKISAAIFILLAVMISLFPPFKFNENLRTLGMKRFKKEIIDEIPLKRYDFLFGADKKYITMDYATCYVKFYNKETLERYENIWNYCNYSFYKSSVDTFYIYRKFLFKKIAVKDKAQWGKQSRIPKAAIDFLKANPGTKDFFDEHYGAGMAAKYLANSNNLVGDIPYWVKKPPNKSDEPQEFDPSTVIPDWANREEAITPDKITFYPGYIDIDYNNNLMTFDNEVEDAVNYDKVKNEYLKTPDVWDFKYIANIDGIKKYDVYKIKYPISPLLTRQILFGELIVEYILAFFVSILAGYLISKLKLKKQAT